ncbi:hypothetical protein HFO56_02725 [Rhizobium laguerreae]|uniref:hypothetical protein n=1 Tax=Rhizobium laguerreae TaxID=1076926 RepID=UPI001C92927D|nr:hypothetical protein [Rhizobium laguerreae]MBY3151300.1 hypothetical protein [Rhizobium laguerreae]
MTIRQTFVDSIAAIKTQAAQIIMDTIEDAPQAALGHIKETTDRVFGVLSTSEKLHLVAEIKDAGGIDVNLRVFDDSADIAELADLMLGRCVEHHLEAFRDSIACSAFAVGFLPAADRMIEVAERSAGSKWMPKDRVEAMRAAHERLAGAEGTSEDLSAVIHGVNLFRALMRSPKDKVLHQRHNTNMEEMKKITAEVNYYRDLLGYSLHGTWQHAPQALEAINDRQPNLPLIQAETERKRLARSTTL